MTLDERKQKEREIRLNDIVDAAEKVFFEKGYLSSTMDEIAQAAEFTKRTLYQYFSSKEDIYLRVIGRGFQKLNEITEDLLKNHQPPTGLDKVMLLGQAWIVLSEQHPHYFMVINDYENYDQQLAAENVNAQMCYQASDKSMQVLLNALISGKEDGSIDPSLEVKNMALAAWGNMIGLINLVTKKSQYLESAHGMSKTELIENTFELLRRALVKREEK